MKHTYTLAHTIKPIILKHIHLEKTKHNSTNATRAPLPLLLLALELHPTIGTAAHVGQALPHWTSRFVLLCLLFDKLYFPKLEVLKFWWVWIFFWISICSYWYGFCWFGMDFAVFWYFHGFWLDSLVLGFEIFFLVETIVDFIYKITLYNGKKKRRAFF